MKRIKQFLMIFVAFLFVLVGCGKEDKNDARTDAEKVQDAVTYVSQYWTANKFASDGAVTDFDLINKKDGVKITYVSDNTEAVAISEDNTKAIVTRSATVDQMARITATFTLNEVTESKKFGVLVPKGVNVGKVSITEALALADETFVIIEATVIRVDIPWDAGYGNMSVTIADGDNFENTLYVYRTKTLLEVNDFIHLEGTITSYNGARQIAAGSEPQILGKGTYVPPAIKECTITEALAEEDGTQVAVTGTVIRIDTPWSDSYGNLSVTIADGDNYENELYIYRLSTKVEVKDIIKVTGYMATYNGNRQIAQGATAEINGKNDNYTPVVAKEVTITEALAEEDGVLVKVTGTVIRIDTPWDDGYGNISVTIADGDNYENTLYVYRLSTKVEVNDVVEVTGYMATYNNARQINQGGTAVITGKGNYDGGTTDEPENPGTEEPTPSEPTLVTAPVVGTEYLLGMDHTTLGDTYYFTGAMSGFYFATSTNPEEAVKVVLEAGSTEGSYYAYFVDANSTKQYLKIYANGTYTNVGYGETAECEFTINEEYGVLVTPVNGTNYYFGSNGTKTYSTLAACKEQYIASDFKAQFYTYESTGGSTEPEEPENPGTEEPTPSEPEEPTPGNVATISFSDVANRTAQDDSKQVWEQNGITVTNDRAESTQPIKDYSNPARFYANTTLTVAYTSTFTKVEFTTTSDKKFTESFSIEGATITIDGTTTVVEFSSPVSSFTFKIVSQIRVSEIKILA